MKAIDFNTLCAVTKDVGELSSYFYKLSLSMETIHNKGYYIADFRPNNINYDIEHDRFILEVEKIKSDKEQYIKNNILTYAKLLDVIDRKYDGEIALDYVKKLNNDNGTYYYHDYINNINKLEGNGLASHKEKIKATAAGIMFAAADNNEENIDYSKAAFISVPVMFVMAGVLVILMIMIFLFINA